MPFITRPSRARGLLSLAATGLLSLLLSSAALAQSYSISGRSDLFSGPQARGITVRDLNNDGFNDVVVANRDAGNIAVFLADGAGGLSAPVTYPCPATPIATSIADVNGDYIWDIVTACFGAGSVAVFYGDGAGAFVPGPVVGPVTQASMAVSADLDRDGHGDLAAVSYDSGQLVVFLADGLGGFGPGIPYATGSSPFSVAPADMDSDGILDLVTSNSGGSISVLRGVGDGSFHARNDFPAGTEPTGLVLGLFNADAVPDAAVADFQNGTVNVLLGDGSGGLGSPSSIGVGGNPLGIAVADLDVDGKLDLVTGSITSNSVQFLKGDGAGGFLVTDSAPTLPEPRSVGVGDVSGDGEPEIITANSAPGTISVFAGDVSGGFRVGSPAAELIARDQDGTVRQLSSDLGKWVVLDLSAVWCTPCKRLAEETQQVYDAWLADGSIAFEFLTVLVENADGGPSTQLDASGKWATRFGISRPVLHGEGVPHAAVRGYYDALGAKGYPTLVYINPAGSIAAIDVGAADGQAILNRVATLAGVSAPTLFPPPPPPPPAGDPRPRWLAMTGATVEVTYGAQSWSGVVPQQVSEEKGTVSIMFLQPPSLPGIPTPGLVYLKAVTDSTTDFETVQVFVGTANPLDPPIPFTEPWQVKVTNITWPDGAPRVLGKDAPILSVVNFDQTLGADQYFPTPIFPTATMTGGGYGFDLSPFVVDGVLEIPPTTNAFSIDVIRLRRSSTVDVSPVAEPRRLALAAAQPNPVQQRTTLRWSMPRQGPATLRIVDVSGRVVRTLHSGPALAGDHATAWDRTDGRGGRVAPGVYFAVFDAAGEVRSTRMVVLE